MDVTKAEIETGTVASQDIHYALLYEKTRDGNPLTCDSAKELQLAALNHVNSLWDLNKSARPHTYSRIQNHVRDLSMHVHARPLVFTRTRTCTCMSARMRASRVCTCIMLLRAMSRAATSSGSADPVTAAVE